MRTTLMGAVGLLALAQTSCETADTSDAINQIERESAETVVAYGQNRGYTPLSTPRFPLHVSHVYGLREGDGFTFEQPVCAAMYPGIQAYETQELWPAVTVERSENAALFASFLNGFLAGSPTLQAGVKNAGSVTIRFPSPVTVESILVEQYFQNGVRESESCAAAVNHFNRLDLGDQLRYVSRAVRSDDFEIEIKFNEGSSPSNDVAAPSSASEALTAPQCGTFVAARAGFNAPPDAQGNPQEIAKFEAAGGQCTKGTWTLKANGTPFYIAFVPITIDEYRVYNPGESTARRSTVSGEDLDPQNAKSTPPISEGAFLEVLGDVAVFADEAGAS